MKLLIGITAAMTVAVVTPGWAQWPPAIYPDPNRYRFVSPTPEDAYRDGLIISPPARCVRTAASNPSATNRRCRSAFAAAPPTGSG